MNSLMRLRMKLHQLFSVQRQDPPPLSSLKYTEYIQMKDSFICMDICPFWPNLRTSISSVGTRSRGNAFSRCLAELLRLSSQASISAETIGYHVIFTRYEPKITCLRLIKGELTPRRRLHQQKQSLAFSTCSGSRVRHQVFSPVAFLEAVGNRRSSSSMMRGGRTLFLFRCFVTAPLDPYRLAM